MSTSFQELVQINTNNRYIFIQHVQYLNKGSGCSFSILLLFSTSPIMKNVTLAFFKKKELQRVRGCTCNGPSESLELLFKKILYYG